MKENKILLPVLFLFFAFVLVGLFSAAEAPAQQVIKVAVLPFEIHSEKDSADLQKQLQNYLIADLQKNKIFQIASKNDLASLIADKKITEKLAREIGERAGADFVIFGSLTQFGAALSIDAKVLPINEDKTRRNIFVQGRGIENLSKLSGQLSEKVVLIAAGDKRISAIQIKGAVKIETSAILNVIKSAKGKNLSETDINDDVKAIYKMGYFEDIQVDVEDTPAGKILTFLIKEKPAIAEIKYAGNKAVDVKDIEGAIATKTHQLVDREKIRSDVEKIRDLYLGKGYRNVEITPEITPRPEKKEVVLTFKIIEGGKIFIKKISFQGNQAFSSRELRKLMDTNEWGPFHFITDSGLLKSDKLNEDLNKLTVLYLNNGYIHARIGNPIITSDKKGINITIPISEGKRFKVGKVDITGDLPAQPKAQLLAKLKINKQNHYDREAIMQDMDALAQLINDEGYAYADVTPDALTHDQEQVVDVTYRITKNEKIYFNKITVKGNTKTRDKVIRRELPFAEGDLYSRAKIKESNTNLNRLGYFEGIDFQAEKGPENNQMDIGVQVKEKSTGMFSLGAGYSATNGAVLTGGVSQQNLFGRGQTLAFQASLGGKSSSISLSFTEPWLFDIPLWSKYEIWHTTTEYDTYDLSSSGFGLTVGYPIWKKVVGYVGYRLSMDDVSNVDSTASSYIKRQEGNTTTSSITTTLSRDTTDDNMFPTTGSRNSLGIEYAGGILGGTASFVKYSGISAWFYPLPKDLVFGIKGRMGYIQELEGKEIPVWHRFYVGGINSIRGLRQVGPLDPHTGDTIGGITMITLNTEIVFPIVKKAGIKGLTFFDMGNAWSRGYHLDQLRKTVGIGLRWYSPMGPLRLEWGYILDRKYNEPTSRLEFTIGYFM